jgi:hypothetical protein
MQAERLGDLRETIGRIEKEEAYQQLLRKAFRPTAVFFDPKMPRNAGPLR